MSEKELNKMMIYHYQSQEFILQYFGNQTWDLTFVHLHFLHELDNQMDIRQRAKK